MRVEVAIVGGGPAGLAAAIAAASRGLSVAVLERQALPVDKACGEGIMPYGVRALERNGVRALIDPRACLPFHGLRYLDASGAWAEGAFRSPGLAVRRPALCDALARRARELGAQVLERTAVESFDVGAEGVVLRTRTGEVRAAVLVAADGLHSAVRRQAGLHLEAVGPARYGLRQHFELSPWTDRVEVHLTDGAEAYVTPVGPSEVGVAFLFERAAERTSFDALLAGFPALRERLGTAQACSAQRGAGPFAQAVRTPVARRLVLLGDAAGYVDAITGEGLSMAFEAAERLGGLLPQALREGAPRVSFTPYVRAHRRAFTRYAQVARAVLAVARRPWLRRRVVHLLGRSPTLFGYLLEAAMPRGEQRSAIAVAWLPARPH